MVKQLRVNHRPIALDDPRLAEGWWSPESDGTQSWRWTNGNALLPLVSSTPVLLEITLGETPSYMMEVATGITATTPSPPFRPD